MDQIENESVLLRDCTILTNKNNIENISIINEMKIKKNSIVKNENEKIRTSVRNDNPLRINFKKSHTCGSLYAKCACNITPLTIKTSITTIPIDLKIVTGSTIITNNNNNNNNNIEKRRAFFQTYSHPDTPFIFTNDNKNPLDDKNNKNREHNKFCTKDGKVEITNSKRLSTPNIGNYSLLDIAVHPEIVLKVSKGIRKDIIDSPIKLTHRSDSETINSTDKIHEITRRTKSESATNQCNTDSDNDNNDNNDNDNNDDDNCFSNVCSENTLRDSIESLDDINKSGKSSDGNSSKSSTELPIKFAQIETDYETDLYEDTKITNNLVHLKYNTNNYQSDTQNSAHKFFQESGILGPMGNGTSNLNRKSSKIAAATDSNIRKNSKAFQKTIDTKDNSVSDDESIRTIVAKKETKSYQDEIHNLKIIIKRRDDEINKLKREIHKLKSVLQQTVTGDCDLLSSLQTHHCMAGQQSVNCINCVGNINGNNKLQENSYNTNNINNTNNNNNNNNNNYKTRLSSNTAVKKQGVSGESCDPGGQLLNDFLIKKFDKDFRSKQLIKDAIMENDFLKNIDSSQVRELVDSMYNYEVAKGEFVIREGDAGAHLYVSAEGDFEVVKDGKVLGTMGAGKAFGELAILYNCTRTASIRVLTDSKLWVLDRRVFQQIMMRTGMQRIEENVNFLRSVPLLKDLSHDVLTKIADVLEVEFYPVGAYIIRQGASGDTFYLISQGDVKVTQRLAEDTNEEEIRTLGRGDYFGEQALIKEDKRTANIIALSPGVECLTLDRESFTQLIGDLCELHEKDYGDHERVFSLKQSQLLIPTLENIIKKEYLDIKLQDLESVATLGLGGFGRVELVKHIKNNQINAYALKCLKKQHIIETRQEEHVFSERTIMLTCDSSFICRLYRTFKDNKYIYMLLEACMGGEIWTILRDRGNFDDITTQFIIGCVLQAFDYLHARGIVYRDLKPENLMLDSKGYVKLVDFGFAKYIGYSSKTWTFCGTPEYVAPEIILNKGHDRAVDYWALGILIHELLTGTPPFTASDPMKTYNIILKGIDMVDFPRHMSRSAISLIKRLCRDVPVERLGYQKGRIQDIKKHKWFQGFDWDGLANLKLQPPIIHPIRHPLDTGYFDVFPSDTDIPPDEISGWDINF